MNVERCNICGVVMDQPDLPETKNCGGDCLKCMAEIGEDPDCINAMWAIREERGKMKKEEIVMYDSPEAASIQTLTGWVDRHGRFWGKDEHMARFAGSTHQLCDKNPEHGIRANNSYCEACYIEREHERFQTMARQLWDWKTMLHLHGTDTYLSDVDDIRDHCIENGIYPEELQLVVCTPNYPSQIDGCDHYCDDLPDGGDLPQALQEAFDRLNEVIRASEPLSWSPGKIAAILPENILTPEERAEIETAKREAVGAND